MQHQTVPQTTVDLSHAGVDNILAALANAGVEVHYNETDGETFLDIWLTDLDADTPVVLGWRDSEGRQLRSWDSNDTAQPPTRKWPIEAGTHAEVARDVAAILADDEKPKPAASYRVTFDLMAGIEPITVPAGATVAEIAANVRQAFEAAGVEIDVKVKVDLTDGVVTVANEDGDVIEHGSITRVDEQPPAKPDLRHLLAAWLHRIADDIVRLELPLPETMCGDLGLGVLDSRADLERWAEYLGTTVETNPTNNIPSAQHRILLDGRPYGAWLTVRAQIQPEASTELERLQARVAELEAQQSAGGTR